MQTLFQNVLTAGLHGSIVTLAVLLLRLVLKKVPRKYFCLLWLLAFLRLLMPFEIRFGLSLQPDVETLSRPETTQTQQPLPDPVPAVPEDAVLPPDTEVVYGDAFTPPESIPEGMEGYYPSVEEETHLVIDWNRILVSLWLMVAVGLVLYSLSSYGKLKRRVREAVRSADGVWECAGLETAFILGWIRPRVYLPMGLTGDTRRHILRHERTHLKRRDHWLKLLAFGAVCVHWFNPLVWTAWVLLCRDMELACDEQVVKDMGLAERKDYSAALLRCSTARNRYMVCPVAFGEVSVKTRILSVLNYRRPGFWITLAGVVAVVFVVVFLMTSPEEPPEELKWAVRLRERDVASIELYKEYTVVQPDKAYQRYEGEELRQIIRYINDIDAQVSWEQKDWDPVVTLVVTMKDGTVHRLEKNGSVFVTVDDVFCVADSQWLRRFPYEGNAALPEGTDGSGNEASDPEDEFASWGVLFRVDDDVLSSRGSYVYVGQDETGKGTLNTTNAYWLERYVDGSWEVMPVLNTPEWEHGGIGVPRGSSTYGYIDWSVVYGPLEPGKYRMGKTIDCYIPEEYYTNKHDFYSEFEIFESVDSDSPEAAAAVERCYAAVEELKYRQTVHMESGWGEEWEKFWIDGENYLRISYYPGHTNIPYEEWVPSDKVTFPRTDTWVRYNGVGYTDVREDPYVLVSEVLGVGVYSLFSPDKEDYRAGRAHLDFFDRNNQVISFPENVGVISDELVRFRRGDAVVTYRFDGNGKLEYLEYHAPGEEWDFIYWVNVYDTTREEIDAAIRSYTEDPYMRAFSWKDAQEKYTDDKFNIREDSFVNNGGDPIAGPLDAIKLALAEYPNLRVYLSLEVSRDEAAGMWKVTIEAYETYQSTTAYRDIYLTDDGETKLLVYEGPLGYSEKRK